MRSQLTNSEGIFSDPFRYSYRIFYPLIPEEAEKACHKGNNRHLKGLNSFAEEYAARDLILVSNDPAQRRMGNCNVLPWKVFLEKLWAGEIIA